MATGRDSGATTDCVPVRLTPDTATLVGEASPEQLLLSDNVLDGVLPAGLALLQDCCCATCPRDMV